MYTGRIIFLNLWMLFLNTNFKKNVACHKGDYRVRNITCCDHIIYIFKT